MTAKLYLTLWFYSSYRGFWVHVGDTGIKPVQPIYHGDSTEALRFFKYAHFVKSEQYLFFPVGVDPNKVCDEPYQVDSAYLAKLGLLHYENGKPVTKISEEPKKFVPVSDFLIEGLKTQESLSRQELEALYPKIDVVLALKKLKSQLIIEGDRISSIK